MSSLAILLGSGGGLFAQRGLYAQVLSRALPFGFALAAATLFWLQSCRRGNLLL